MSLDPCPNAVRVAARFAAPGARLDPDLAAHMPGCEACRRAVTEAVRAWPADHAPSPSLVEWLTGPVTIVSMYQAELLAGAQAAALELGPYLLLDRIDAGGMGEVFRAWHRLLLREDAVKTLRPELTAEPDVVRRFLREAESAARLRHPNVVTVYTADQIDGRYYLAMELVIGTDLQKFVRSAGPLPVATACDYARQAAEGLEHAYQSGLVHRDVKPANLLVTADGRTVKVADFGLARALDPDVVTAVTRTGSVIGTVDYMAPEQADDSRAADARSDVYSLGCTLYYLLTGEVPFPGGGLRDRVIRHANTPPPPVRETRPDVPAAVEAIVLKCMAKSPDRRYQTPGELAMALAALTPHAAPDSHAATRRAGDFAPAATGRDRRVWVGLGFLGLVAAAVVWVVVTRSTGPNSPEGAGRNGPGSAAVPVGPAGLPGGAEDAALDGVPLPQTTDRGPWKFSAACWSGQRGAVEAVGFLPDGSVHAGRASAEPGMTAQTVWECWPSTGGGKPTHRGRTPADPRGPQTPLLIHAGGYYTSRFNRYEPKTLRPLVGLSDDVSAVNRGRSLEVFCLFATADGASLLGDATAADGGRLVVRWDAKSGEVRKVWPVTTRDLLRDVVPDRTGAAVATGTVEGRVLLLTADSRREWVAPNGPDGTPDRVWAVAVSPDGRNVYSGHGGRRVLVWDAARDAHVRELPVGAWSANRLQVSPDGRWLVAVGAGVKVWDLRADPPTVHTLAGDLSTNLNRVAFNADGTRIAASGPIGVVWLWDLKP